jgi:O-acetyl-ADP-ribose deacetylase
MRKVIAVLADITELDVDVIVNAANESMSGGGGVDGAIHRAAGPLLVKETKKAAPLYVARTYVTDGFNLKAKKIVHTVGPMYGRGDSGEYIALEMCYRNCIFSADFLGARSVAIPAISAGVYGFPQDRAAKIAVQASMSQVDIHKGIEQVLLVAYDEKTYDLYLEYIEEYSKPKTL